MSKCEFCGKNFDEYIDSIDFDSEYGYLGFSYDCFRKKLCYDCAKETIDNKNDGAYFETCEVCGKDFDYAEEYSKFDDIQRVGDSDTDLYDCRLKEGGPICADCAFSKYM